MNVKKTTILEEKKVDTKIIAAKHRNVAKIHDWIERLMKRTRKISPTSLIF